LTVAEAGEYAMFFMSMDTALPDEAVDPPLLAVVDAGALPLLDPLLELCLLELELELELEPPQPVATRARAANDRTMTRFTGTASLIVVRRATLPRTPSFRGIRTPGRDRTTLCCPFLMARHFLTGAELSAGELNGLLDRADALKRDPRGDALDGRSVALVFEKPSTRTRLSFEAGVFELGGHPLVLRESEMQISRGESVRDTALVLSRHVAAIGLRTGPHAIIEELAAHAGVPVVNMLTAEHHPCQALADLMTVREAVGHLEGVRLAYVGDGNNVARSLAIVGGIAGMEIVVSSPPEFRLDPPAGATLIDDPAEAVAGAQVVYTDVWISMGDEATAEARRSVLGPYRVDDALLDRAADGAFALHCLPAHPGEEISESVLYGERQRIWDQAENRRHAQKALLELLVSG
jgi:ornithine carbamoyltransferase